MDVLRQLGVATMMVSLTVLIHFVGLSILLALISRYRPSSSQARNVVGNATAILSAAFGLFALHGLEIWAYAVVSALLGHSSPKTLLRLALKLSPHSISRHREKRRPTHHFRAWPPFGRCNARK